MSIFSFRGRSRKLKKSLRSKRASTATRRLRVRVVEHEALGDQIRVEVEDRAVQIEQALLVDEDPRILRPFEHFVAEARLLLPREGVAEARAPAALDADAESALVEALPGHQRLDLVSGDIGDLNHDSPAGLEARPARLRRWLRSLLGRLAFSGLLLLVIGDGGLDGVLRQNRAVNLHRRQTQLSDDVGVLDRKRLLDGLALEPLGGQARA